MSGTLTHSPADVLRYLLVGLGLGTLPSGNKPWPIGVSLEPDLPDNVITLFDTSGILGGRTQTDGEQQEHHGIQLRVRAATHPVGYAKADALKMVIDAIVNRVVSVPDVVGTATLRYRVWNVSRKGGILAIGDESPTSKRKLFTFNVVVALRQL